MRRIRTQEEIAKSDKRKALIIGLILIFLMLFSTAGYALLSGGFLGGSGTGSETEVSDGTFNGNYWIYQRFGAQLFLTYSMEEISSIPVNINLGLADYSNQPVFLASDSDIVNVEISNNLGQFTGRLQEACYGPCEDDLPEKGCSELLIIYEESENPEVSQQESCIFIKGDLKAVDAFIYKIFEIV